MILVVYNYLLASSFVVLQTTTLQLFTINNTLYFHFTTFLNTVNFNYIFLHRCIYGCMFCVFLCDFVNYVILLLYVCILTVVYVLFYVFCFSVLFCVLFVCKYLPCYCHQSSTQLQLTNISISIHLVCTSIVKTFLLLQVSTI